MRQHCQAEIIPWRSSFALLIASCVSCFLDLTCLSITIIRWRILQKRTSMTWNRTEKSLLLLTCSLCVSLCFNCILD
ncbi:unnamed protein product [Cylicocyclus nassatus]|uniref:Uncharacterized protein n=1 Tax=Cylicocyclus nassatus TaxID=53992 RepID=A0AA36DN26_CYLNA|nr:unnamed protein product [Cylicocyclus nassatus]